MVDDVRAAAGWARGLGAVPLDDGGVFADPAGHPFCLIPRPSWAAPLDGDAAAPPTGGHTRLMRTDADLGTAQA